ncbi:hypothetical protein BH11PLA2_BH11PLA2_35700 [soil metagenome]
MTRRTQRAGLTLTETLVALFIAALGMISLLTLFPLGALQMGQALKDGRCAQSAQEADNLIRWYSSKYGVIDPNHEFQKALARGDYTTLYGTAPNQTNAAWLNPGERNSSYPVFVDPQGFNTTWPGSLQNVRVTSQAYLPRRSIYRLQGGAASAAQLPASTAEILRFTMLQDDLTYNTNKSGAPIPYDSANTTNPTVERGGRYNWLWVLQRPEHSRQNVIGLTCVVFDQRAPLFASATTEQIFTKSTATVDLTYTPGTTSLQIYYGTGTKPAISKGRWIMDSTAGINRNTSNPSQYMDPPENPADPNVNVFYGLRHANFYRVTSVNDETAGTLVLELETPIRRNDGGNGAYTGRVVVLTGAAEVFERPPLVLE